MTCRIPRQAGPAGVVGQAGGGHGKQAQLQTVVGHAHPSLVPGMTLHSHQTANQIPGIAEACSRDLDARQRRKGSRTVWDSSNPDVWAPQRCAHRFWMSRLVLSVGKPQQPRSPASIAEAHSRVLDVQAGPIREIDAEGHGGGSADDGSPILLLQALMEDLHVQQAQKSEGSTDFSIS